MQVRSQSSVLSDVPVLYPSVKCSVKVLPRRVQRIMTAVLTDMSGAPRPTCTEQAVRPKDVVKLLQVIMFLYIDVWRGYDD